MIKNIKAIFFDIDGTLVPFGTHKILELFILKFLILATYKRAATEFSSITAFCS